MAGSKEVPLSVASAVGKKGLPDPLVITFRGQSLSEAGDVVRGLFRAPGTMLPCGNTP